MVGRIIKRVKEDRPLQIFLTIFLIGAVLRSLKLVSESFWYDEILTALSLKLSFFDMIRDRLASGHSPFYFILVYPFARLLGNNELVIRLPSAIASIISVYVFFLLAKKLFSDIPIPRSPLPASHLASLFFSFSALNIYFATEARPYAFSVLFAISSFYFLLRALDEEGWKLWAIYVLCAAANIYCSAVSLPILAAQAVYVVIRRRKYADFMLASSFIILLYVPMAYFYLSMKKLGFIEWVPPVTLATCTNILYGYGYYPVPVFNAVGALSVYLEAAKFLSVWLLGGLILFGLVQIIWRARRDLEKMLLPILWLLVPLIFFIAYSFLIRPIFGPKRYVIDLSPAYYLLLAYGLMRIDRAAVRRSMIGIVTAFFIFTLLSFYSVPTKEDWRGAVSYIDSHYRAGDAVIGDAATAKAFEYYGLNAGVRLSPPFLLRMRAGLPNWILLKEVDFKVLFPGAGAFEKSFRVRDGHDFNGLKLYYVK